MTHVPWSRVLGVAGIALIASGLVPSASSAEAPLRDRAEITGTGAWSVNNQMNAWKAALYYSEQAMDLSYLAKGDRDGRHIFAAGEADFVVSGMPLTAGDQAELDARGVKVVSAPFSVASAALLWSGPFPTGVRTFVADPEDPEEGTLSEYHGKLRLPSTTLARIFVDRGINNWYDADFRAANADLLPPGADWAPVLNPTAPLVRSDPSATNFYLQKVVERFSPDQFLLKLAEAGIAQYQTSESWPFLDAGSRTGSVNAANLVAGWQNPKAGVIPSGGIMTAAPISEVLSQKADFPATPLFIPELQNAAGEWVAPTPESISIAVDKGDGKPLAALDAVIPGGYPLVWVNRVFAPASGLSIDKTNAIAAMVRYAVTTGQDAATAIGEGRLSEKLVSEALTAADQIVAGNCVGTDRKVVLAADGGPLWPTGAVMPVGTFTVCEPASRSESSTSTVHPETPTTAHVRVEGSSLAAGNSISSGGPSGAVVSSGSRSGSSGPVGTASVDDYGIGAPVGDFGVDAGTESLVASTAAPDDVAPTLAAASLPMRLPGDGRGSLDQLSTMLLGGLCLLLARGASRRSKVVTS